MSGTCPSFSSVKIGTSVSFPTPSCMKRRGPTQSKKLTIFNGHEGPQDRMRCNSYPQSSHRMLRWLNRKTIPLQCGKQNDRGRLGCKGKTADLVFLSFGSIQGKEAGSTTHCRNTDLEVRTKTEDFRWS